MGWNGSDLARAGANATPVRKEASPKPKASRRWTVLAIAALAIIAVVIALVCLLSGDETPVKDDKPVAVRKIKDQQPAQPKVQTPVKREKFKPKTKPDKTANVIPPEVERDQRFEFYHNINPKIVGTHELFHNECDVMICDVLVAHPGERLVGIELDADFDKRFLEDIKTPIPAHEKDTEYDTALKNAVTKWREQLADDLKAKGLSPREAIQQARDELNKIADYRDMIEQELSRVAEKEDEEFCDQFVAEANTLLDEYGAFHIKLGKKTRARIRERIATQGATPSKPSTDGKIITLPTSQE